MVRRQAVDISPLRRVNQAIWLLTTGAREAAFRNIKTIAECLADELINAAKGSSNRLVWHKRKWEEGWSGVGQEPAAPAWGRCIIVVVHGVLAHGGAWGVGAWGLGWVDAWHAWPQLHVRPV